MSRGTGWLLIVGVGLMVMGGYDFFIQVGTSREPTAISVAELEKGVPSNRHLMVTGGRAMMDQGVVCCKIGRYGKVPGSEVYFIPIQDAALAAYRSLTPPLLVLITQSQMDNIRKSKGFDTDAIHGVRMTHWDLEDKAKEILANTYGEAAVKRMIILEYEKDVTGVADGLWQMVLGAVCFVILIVVANSQRSRT